DLGVDAVELRPLLDLVDRDAGAAAIDPGDRERVTLADARADERHALAHLPADLIRIASTLDLDAHLRLLAVGAERLAVVVAADVDVLAVLRDALVRDDEDGRVLLRLELLRPGLALGVEAHLQRVALQLVDAEHGVVFVLALADDDVNGGGRFGGVEPD